MDRVTALPRVSQLVFPNEDGGPGNHLLLALKDTAARVGIDPKRANLPSFRRTGATR